MMSGGNTSPDPPELPDGWRHAEPGEWRDTHVASHTRLRLLRVVIPVLVVGLVVGIALWNAASHYARGVRAMESHSYEWAANELSAARVFGLPYRDARDLERKARQAAAASLAEFSGRRQTEDHLASQLSMAGTRLKAGDTDSVLAAVQAIDAAELRAVVSQNEAVRQSASALAEHLATASRRALRDRSWARAESLAAALLVLEPSSESARSIQTRAQTAKDLTAKLDKAKKAAKLGKWRLALRTALAVLAVQKDFPGAAAVVADARKALAPKPRPVTRTTSPASTGGSVTTVPAAPAAPQPPPP